MEDIDGAAIDDPKAWKVALDVSQDVLKFTSLWVEYAQFDQGFIAENLPYAFGKLGDYLDGFTTFGADTDVIFVAAKQEWNDKWSTFGRYAQFDPDGGDKAKDWAVGVGYQYSPNLYFELAYNKMDVGANGVPGFEDGSFIRFRTLLTF